MTGKVTDWFSVSDERRWYTHPTFLSAAALFVLVIVAAGVYSIAAKATDVTRNAEATIALTETLRLSSAMRSDVSTITVLGQVSDAGMDTAIARSDLFESLQSGTDRLENVDRASGLGDIDDLTSDALDDFVAATKRLIAEDASQPSVNDFGAAHTALTATVVEQREALVTSLEGDARAMNRTGSTTGYVVAFIVPALALYIFEALRRMRLRSKLTQQANESLHNDAQASAALDASDLSMLEDHAAALVATARIEDPKARGHLDGIRRSSAALRTRAIARGAALTTALGPVDVSAALVDILNEAGLGHLELVSSLEGETALADAKNLRFAMRELLGNALTHGADPIRLKAYPWNDTVTITVSDQGPGLSPEIQRIIFQADLRTMRQHVASSGEAAGLVAVRSLIEAMGGSFEYERQDDTTIFVLRLQPADVERRSYRPAVASL